jgi:hypothetical protein
MTQQPYYPPQPPTQQTNAQPPQQYAPPQPPQQQPAPPAGGDPWTPATGGSGAFSPSQYVGALVLITVRAFHANLPGSFGARDAIECGVDIIDYRSDPSQNGTGWETSMIYGSALVPDLTPQVGKYVLGRLIAKPTKNPQPVIVLEPPTDQDNIIAQQWYMQMKSRGEALRSLEPKPQQQVQQANQQHAQAFQQMQQQQPQNPMQPPPGSHYPPPQQHTQPPQQPQQWAPPQSQDPPF